MWPSAGMYCCCCAGQTHQQYGTAACDCLLAFRCCCASIDTNGIEFRALYKDMDANPYKLLIHMLRVANNITLEKVMEVAQELRDSGCNYLNRVVVNIAAFTVCAEALACSTLGHDIAKQLRSYCLNVWAQRCQELLESLTPIGAATW